MLFLFSFLPWDVHAGRIEDQTCGEEWVAAGGVGAGGRGPRGSWKASEQGDAHLWCPSMVTLSVHPCELEPLAGTASDGRRPSRFLSLQTPRPAHASSAALAAFSGWSPVGSHRLCTSQPASPSLMPSSFLSC